MSASSAFVMAAKSERLLVLIPLATHFQTGSERQRSEGRDKEHALLDSSCQLHQSHELVGVRPYFGLCHSHLYPPD
jgi:hypothetical protein